MKAIDNKELILALEELEKEKGIKKEQKKPQKSGAFLPVFARGSVI